MIHYAVPAYALEGVLPTTTPIDKRVLECRECGSGTFVIYGAPYSVQCAECRAEFSQVSDFIALAEAETEKQELKRQKRRLH